MKRYLRTSIKTIVGDRQLLILVLLNIIIATSVAIVMAVSIQPHYTQVIARFSSYGISGFYRDVWYSLYVFPVMAFVILIGHVALSVKLVSLNRRDLAVALLILTIFLLIILLIMAKSIIGVAALG